MWSSDSTHTQYTVHSTQYTVHSTQYTVHSTHSQLHSTQYTVHSTQYTVHSTHTHSYTHIMHTYMHMLIPNICITYKVVGLKFRIFSLFEMPVLVISSIKLVVLNSVNTTGHSISHLSSFSPTPPIYLHALSEVIFPLSL